MNKSSKILIGIVVIGLGVLTFLSLPENAETPTISQVEDETDKSMKAAAVEVKVNPVSHASFVLTFGDFIIVNDPVGSADRFLESGQPDVILVSDIHGDHLSVDTLIGLLGEQTQLIAPQAVIDEMPEQLVDQTMLLENGDSHQIDNLFIEATPMYNLPMEGPDYRHVKGRGNGYLLQIADTRVYSAGDTEDIPEMRALADIDYAFVPMNLPYTMDVAAAADAVLEFEPRVVYPYHYRGPEGLSDIDQFAELVGNNNPAIEVVLLDWYPEE